MISLCEAQIQCSVHDRLLTVHAEDYPLTSLFDELSVLYGFEWNDNLRKAPNVTIHVKDMTLEELLNRLGVSYALTTDTTGNYLKLTVSNVKASIAPVEDDERRALIERIEELVANLYSDDIRYNALESLSLLAELGPSVIPYMEEVMADDDLQARQFAAHVLCMLGDDYEPSDLFFERLVEGTADDGFPMGDVDNSGAFNGLMNAKYAYEYFRDNPDWVMHARTHLEKALYGNDAQQRFLTAVILGKVGERRHLNRMVAILTPHLKDNNLESDGGLACYALYHMGPAVRPYLEPLVSSSDEQQAKLAKLLLQHFDKPTQSSEPLMRNYNEMIHDPAVELTPAIFSSWYPDNFPPH